MEISRRQIRWGYIKTLLTLPMSKGDLQFCSFIVKFSSSGDKNPIQSRHSDGSSEQDLKKYLIGKRLKENAKQKVRQRRL